MSTPSRADGAQHRVAFLHPDLGLGGKVLCCLGKIPQIALLHLHSNFLIITGAERLIVDAAVELADRGHKVAPDAVARISQPSANNHSTGP